MVVRVVNDTKLLVIQYTDNSVTGASGISAIVLSTVASSGSCRAAQVLEGEVDMDPESERVELLEYPEGVAIYTCKSIKAVRRASLNEEKYNLLENNCECLINWAITDENVSGQGEDAKDTIGSMTKIVAAATVVVSATIISASGKKKDRNTD